MPFIFDICICCILYTFRIIYICNTFIEHNKKKTNNHPDIKSNKSFFHTNTYVFFYLTISVNQSLEEILNTFL